MIRKQQFTGPESPDTREGGGILEFARALGQVFGCYLGSIDSKERQQAIERIVADRPESGIQAEKDDGSQ